MPVSASIEIAAPPEAVRAKVELSHLLSYITTLFNIPAFHFICSPQTCLLTLGTKFLDFSSLPQYHKGFFGSIVTLEPKSSSAGV